MTPDRLDEAHELAGLLFGAVELTRARFDALCAQFRLTPVQARAVLALGEPAPMRALADRLRCDPSNVTGIADRLETRGLVRRETAADRRVKLLVATEQGHALRRDLEAALLGTSPFMATLSGPERRQLATLLRKVNAAGGGSRDLPGATAM